ncbi:hypothetical protein BD410DRAFT_805975 [Rickenella mellea]|uniref:Uncharacterized protein n=1 Tax=Rickenella mellea TaxID=50990 RepID=A0A4Y7PXE0_9AGAM|nr:hypothetical protein BD410DRAFT_805975 [Rickenella mellea]
MWHPSWSGGFVTLTALNSRCASPRSLLGHNKVTSSWISSNIWYNAYNTVINAENAMGRQPDWFSKKPLALSTPQWIFCFQTSLTQYHFDWENRISPADICNFGVNHCGQSSNEYSVAIRIEGMALEVPLHARRNSPSKAHCQWVRFFAFKLAALKLTSGDQDIRESQKDRTKNEAWLFLHKFLCETKGPRG